MEHRYAVVSVYDKEGLIVFSKDLTNLGITIRSTGGTATFLQKAGIPFIEISAVTGFPEMLDGRVKTLHPSIHAGILARRDDKTHLKTLRDHQINLIDFVICNLYPLQKTIPLVGAGFLTDGTLEGQGETAQGLLTTLHYGDGLDNPKNKAFRAAYAKAYKTEPDVYAVQGYDAAQLLIVGMNAVKGDTTKRAELVKAMEAAKLDSPRGTMTFSKSQNPIQDIYLREVKNGDNVVLGLAQKSVEDPGRGCGMT